MGAQGDGRLWTLARLCFILGFEERLSRRLAGRRRNPALVAGRPAPRNMNEVNIVCGVPDGGTGDGRRGTRDS